MRRFLESFHVPPPSSGFSGRSGSASWSASWSDVGEAAPRDRQVQDTGVSQGVERLSSKRPGLLAEASGVQGWDSAERRRVAGPAAIKGRGESYGGRFDCTSVNGAEPCPMVLISPIPRMSSMAVCIDIRIHSERRAGKISGISEAIQFRALKGCDDFAFTILMLCAVRGDSAFGIAA